STWVRSVTAMVTTIGKLGSTIAPGSAPGTTSATTGTASRLPPNPTTPCTVAATATAVAMTNQSATETCTGERSARRGEEEDAAGRAAARRAPLEAELAVGAGRPEELVALGHLRQQAPAGLGHDRSSCSTARRTYRRASGLHHVGAVRLHYVLASSARH